MTVKEAAQEAALAKTRVYNRIVDALATMAAAELDGPKDELVPPLRDALHRMLQVFDVMVQTAARSRKDGHAFDPIGDWFRDAQDQAKHERHWVELLAAVKADSDVLSWTGNSLIVWRRKFQKRIAELERGVKRADKYAKGHALLLRPYRDALKAVEAALIAIERPFT